MSKRIYTRAGDGGETDLLSGDHIGKDDPRVEAYGTVDELISMLGIAKIYSSQRIADYIQNIQETLFIVNSELAFNPESNKFKNETLLKLKKIITEDVGQLEKIADELSDELPLLMNFVIPGGTEAAAFLHVCRTVCRRAERRIISFAKTHTVNEELIRYINRLSDLLFIFSRYENRKEGNGDHLISREGARRMS